jgi:hypothetical protein
MEFFHLQVNRWNWRTSSYVRLVRLRRPKATCSLSYAGYRPKPVAAVLLERITLRASPTQAGWGKGRKLTT